jgi:hypothetical protein
MLRVLVTLGAGAAAASCAAAAMGLADLCLTGHRAGSLGGAGSEALALVHLLPPFGRSKPDPEIQDVFGGSPGLNVGLRYLDGAFNFDSAVMDARRFAPSSSRSPTSS